MSRLIRLDRTGHTTLAEWSGADDVEFRRASEAFARELELGMIASATTAERRRRGGPRAAGRRRARGHAPPDRRRLTLDERAPSRTGEGPEAPAVVVPGELAELANVSWRRRPSAESLRRRGWRWTLWTVAVSAPFVAVAGVLLVLEPLLFPVSLWALAHAVAIPALAARRGARLGRPARRAALGDGRRRSGAGAGGAWAARGSRRP